MLLGGKVSIITGGSRGIGKGIALKFAQEGSNIVIADILMPEANKTVIEIEKLGVKGLAMLCDVTKYNQVKTMVDLTIQKFGKIDILVNDAAFGPPIRSFAEISEEEWDKTINVNLKGTFLCCQAVINHMKVRGYGKIINISSGAAVCPPIPMAHYAASKAGILGMTNDLALEYAPFGIYANAIMPGPVRTELWDPNIPPGVSKDDFFKELGKVVPMKRVGLPEDIANAALFLASDLSNFVTAGQMHVGGGLPLRYQ